jgi:sugar-specific transcriptional regulator TrmB
MNEIDKILSLLELSEKEKIIYKMVLEKGKATPSFISRLTGINRTTVYSVATELKARGLIVEDSSGKIIYLTPASEAELGRIIEKEKDLLKSREQNILNLQKIIKTIPASKSYSVPKIRFVEEQDLEKYLYEATPKWVEDQVANNEMTWWGFQDHTFVEKYKDWIIWFWKKAPKGVNLKLFSNQSQIEEEMTKENIQRRRIRFWSGESNFTGTQWIVGSYIIMIITTERPYYLVEIKDSVTAHNMREVFKKLWEEE